MLVNVSITIDDRNGAASPWNQNILTPAALMFLRIVAVLGFRRKNISSGIVRNTLKVLGSGAHGIDIKIGLICFE